MQSSSDISRAGTVAAIVFVGVTTARVAGAWVSAGTTIVFVSVWATADIAVRMKTKRTL